MTIQKKIIKNFPKHKTFVDLNFNSLDGLLDKKESKKNYVIPDNPFFSGFLDMIKSADKDMISKANIKNDGVLGALFAGKLPDIENLDLGVVHDLLQKTEIIADTDFPTDKDTLIWMSEVDEIGQALELTNSAGVAKWVFTCKTYGDLAIFLSENKENYRIYKEENTLIVSNVSIRKFEQWDGIVPITKIQFREGEKLEDLHYAIRDILLQAAINGELEGWNPSESDYEPWIYICKIEAGRVIYSAEGQYYSIGWQEVGNDGYELVYPAVKVEEVVDFVEKIVKASVNISQRTISKAINSVINKIKFDAGDESLDNIIATLTMAAYQLMADMKFGKFIPLDYSWNSNLAPVYFVSMDAERVIWDVPWGYYKTEWQKMGKGEYSLSDPVEVEVQINFEPVNEESESALENVEVAMSADNKKFPYRIIEKAEEEKKVFGIVLEPLSGQDGEVDLHDDYYSEKTIQEGMEYWMKSQHGNGIQHTSWAGNKITVLQNYLAPVDFELNGNSIKKGTWLLEAQINDDLLWEEVKKGNFTGWSIGAFGIKETVKEDI